MQQSLCLLSICFLGFVSGHGRLVNPPGRSTAWRFGFNVPRNYDDNALFCGGFYVQYGINRGKCGICGDPWNGARMNEFPHGLYARNPVIVNTYKMGETIKVAADITANHNGYFEFKLCPATSKLQEVTQECLDNHTLPVYGSKDVYQYYLPVSTTGIFETAVTLPPNLRCERCVLQWTYVASNSWGKCSDGTQQIGCGPQEMFRGCADISIV